MSKFVITEQEKDEILNQHLKVKPYSELDRWDTKDAPTGRRILDTDLTPFTLSKYKSKGLTPYYYDGDTDIVEINGPIKGKLFDTKPKEVFLLTPEEYDKIKKLSDNIKEIIELKLNSIKLYKQYIPGSLMKIIEEK
jgi:hypothetical protein